jgi:hypothetical protein
MKDRKVSLIKFSARGGKGAMLQRKKEDDTVKAMKKAAALRKYARLCKREGIVSDRVHVDGLQSAQETGGASAAETQRPQQQRHQPKHSSPFASALREASKAKEQKQEEDRNRQTVQDEIKKSEANRNAKRREHVKRNKKGQPLLSSTAKLLLTKIQSSSHA